MFKNGYIVACVRPNNMRNLNRLFKIVNYTSHSEYMSVESMDRREFYNFCDPCRFELYNFEYNSIKDLL